MVIKMIRIADLHCDTLMKLWYARLRKDGLSLRGEEAENGLMTDLAKMKTGGYILQHFACFVDKALPKDFDGTDGGSDFLNPSLSGEGYDPWEQFLGMAAVFREEMEKNTDQIGQACSGADIRRNLEEGRMSAVLTIEEGGALKGGIDHLESAYQAGVRMITLTWNYENELGFPNRMPEGTDEDFGRYFRFQPSAGDGLKKRGFEMLERMQELGILADVSHLSDGGFYDVARFVKGPFVASHSNARSLTGCSRNLTDEMIRMVGEHGGVIGLNFCPHFLEEADREDQCFSSLEAMARHARHIMNVGGSHVLGLGTDFDGIAPVNLEIENAAMMQKLPEYLAVCGFTGEEIEGMMWRNVLDLYV